MAEQADTSPDNEQEVMKTLRELIVGPEKEKIEHIEHKITEIAHPVATVEDVARSLPEAIRLRITQDESLQHALQPVTEQAIQQSVRNNPKPLSDALFPIMGPAIRRSINHTISAMLQSMNQAMEHSFSIRGLRWRIEAMRTGKSFAEVVMLHTLVYRVEQAFIIHRESGLLIAHLATEPEMEEDADLISSMLTAVRDFVRDSFSPDAQADIENLRMGELQLLIDQAPDVTLVLVCRGTVPQELHALMDERLEALQREYGRAFASFDGDTSAFIGIKDTLRPLMVSERQDQEKKSAVPVRALIVLGLLFCGIAGWLGYQSWLNSLWHGYVDRLRVTPGVAVLHAAKEHGHYVLHGLLDAQAMEPRNLLPARLPVEKVEMHWRPYLSLEDEIILRRAVAMLNPPAEVTLTVHDGVLQARGAAPEKWIDLINEKGMQVPGVRQTDIQLRNMDLEPLPDKIQRLLQPPATVQLLLDGLKLRAEGQATESWLAHARQAVETDIPELTSYDDSQVVAVDSPAYLLALARASLKPPASVTLQVDKNRVLHVTGEALTAWLSAARQEAADIPYLASMNTRKLVLLDSPAHIRQLAIKRLKPPASVSLRVSDALVLSAHGEASNAWIARARKRAKTIPYVKAYDDKGVIDPFDRARVLRLARKTLKPPKTIKLDYRGGRLYAGGRADSAWIARAQKLAPGIRGVSVYDDRQVFDPLLRWQEIRQRVRAVHLDFVAGTARVKEEGKALASMASLAEDYDRAKALFASARLEITGISSLYGDRARDIAAGRAQTVGALLARHGVSYLAQQQRIKIVRDEQWGVAFDLVK